MPDGQIQRLTQQGIETTFDEATVRLLRNRARGGDNGYKGTRMEQFFGSHRIARLSQRWIHDQKDSFVEWQSAGFVDDFVIRNDDERAVKAYQLKNSTKVSWTSGSPSIELDFQNQKKMSEAEGYADIRIRLVCSDKDEATKLAAKVPDSIKDYAKAFFFPYDKTDREALLNHDWLSDDFAFLSKHENPEPIQVQHVASILTGAWSTLAPSATVSAVLQLARDTSPTIIRSLLPDRPLDQVVSNEARAVLDRIPDFQYAVKRGFLEWASSGARTSGVLSYDCYGEEFTRWQNALVKLNPTTFSDFEETLT